MKEIILFVLAIIFGGLLVHYPEPAQIEVRTVTKIDPGKEIRVMRAWPNTPEGNRERMEAACSIELTVLTTESARTS